MHNVVEDEVGFGYLCNDKAASDGSRLAPRKGWKIVIGLVAWCVLVYLR